jgi:6-phosphogluconolactonase (cycloisomerase 2 family)
MRSFKHLFLALVAVAGMLLGGCGDDNATIVVVPYSGKFLYVNNDAATNAVSGFAIKANGTLEHLAGSPFVTGGAGTAGWYAVNPIAIARTKKLLFAANNVDSTVTSFTINSNSGELTAVGLPVASGGTMGLGGSLAVDDDENFLFVGNDSTDNISVFSIAANGALTPVAGSPFAIGLADGVDGITLNAVGTALYVSAFNSNQIVVMDVDVTGTLTPIAGSPFNYTAGGNIASFVLASSTRGLSGATGGVLASYSIDAAGAPTLIDSLVLGANSQAISTARRGKLAFLSGGDFSTATNQISVVQMASDGILTQVTGSPFTTAMQTTGYAIANPTGKFLYATEGIFGSVSQIEAFTIDAAGALTSINTYPLENPGYATGLVIY